MKRIIKKVALSGAATAFLVAALLQVAEPTGVRAQEGPNDECSGRGAVCGIEFTYTCKFWILFCESDVDFLFYGDGSDNN